MEKLKNLIPEKFSVIGNNVVITKKEFTGMTNTINAQSAAINSLIDIVNALIDNSSEHNEQIQGLQRDLQALAQAIQVYTEE